MLTYAFHSLKKKKKVGNICSSRFFELEYELLDKNNSSDVKQEFLLDFVLSLFNNNYFYLLNLVYHLIFIFFFYLLIFVYSFKPF